MFQKILIASAATILGAATVVTSTSALAAPRNGQKTAAERKYCFQYHETVGTRIARSECKTKAQWALEGVDVDKLLRN